MKRIVVAGASLSAVTAAEALRAAGYDGQVVLIGAEPHPPYTRPPLSKGVLTGAEPADSVQLAALGDDIELRLAQTITGLDLRDNAVMLHDGNRITFDGLIIATGARARTLARPEQHGELSLRSLDDALALQARLAAAPDVFVIGAGLLGMEIASSCRSLGLDVTVVDREPPMRRQLGAHLSQHLTAAAIRAGVRIETSPGNVELLGRARIEGARLADGRKLHAQLVITAAGDIPNVNWLTGSGLRVEGALIVDQRCRSLPHVVGAGDAVAIHGGNGTLIRRPHWANAVDQARLAATTLLHGEAIPIPATTPYFWTEQFGFEIKIAGEPPDSHAPTTLKGELSDGQAVLQWMDNNGLAIAAATVNQRMPIKRLKRLAGSPFLAAN